MANYNALVKGLTAEFQATENPSALAYQEIVKSRNLPPQQERVLLEFAVDYWAIQHYGKHQPPRTPAASIEDFGIVGEGLGIVGEVLGVVKEAVIDPPLEILTEHTSDELYERAKSYFSKSDGEPQKALARREEEVIRALQGK